MCPNHTTSAPRKATDYEIAIRRHHRAHRHVRTAHRKALFSMLSPQGLFSFHQANQWISWMTMISAFPKFGEAKAGESVRRRFLPAVCCWEPRFDLWMGSYGFDEFPCGILNEKGEDIEMIEVLFGANEAQRLEALLSRTLSVFRFLSRFTQTYHLSWLGRFIADESGSIKPWNLVHRVSLPLAPSASRSTGHTRIQFFCYSTLNLISSQRDWSVLVA